MAGLSDRNDLPLLRAGDLADEILADAASMAVHKVAERRATFSRANVLAEVHRQFQGVRFASPDDRIAVAERTADLAVGQSLLISAPELHYTPERLRRADGTSRFRAKGHEIYTTAILIGGRGPPARGRARDGRSGRRHGHSGRRHVGHPARPGPSPVHRSGPRGGADRHLWAHGSTCWSDRQEPASRPPWPGCGPPGKPNTVRARCSVWPPRPPQPRCWPKHWGSTRRTRPSGSMSTAKKPNGWRRLPTCAKHCGPPECCGLGPHCTRKLDRAKQEVVRWRLRAGQLVIVDEASLLGTFALDELVTAARDARAKVVLVGDPNQLSAIDAGGMFAALVRDRGGLVPELTDVRRFVNAWEKEASVELRAGLPTPSTPMRPMAGWSEGPETRCSTPSTGRGRRTPRRARPA